MIHTSDIPEGYCIEWRVDEDWLIGGGGKQCRATTQRHRCQNSAIVRLYRGRGRRRVLWAYCAEHMYGREIRDGKVMVDCLRALSTPEAKGEQK